MARDATVVLQDLECISQQDSFFGLGQYPYIWPVLMWVDDTTLSDPNLIVGDTTPYLGGSRIVLKENMRPGDRADIPLPLGTMGNRFEDNLTRSQLLLAVLVWMQFDTPDEAVWAGCKAFSSALRSAVAANLSGLVADATQQQTIKIIQDSMADSVRSAIWDALDWFQRTEVLIDSRTLDAMIGSDFKFFPDLTPAGFTLSISDTSGNNYAVRAGLRVSTPVIDLCQAQADQVKAKQASVDAINGQIIILQEQLQHASPAEKGHIVADIKQAGMDLTVAKQDLTDAQAALKACRDRWKRIVGLIPRPPGTPPLTES